MEQSTQGLFIPQGREDILTVAIGRPEHPGRVRAAGRGVGIRKFFGPPPRYYSKLHLSETEMESLKEDIRKEIKKEVYSELKKELLLDMRAELASMSVKPSVAPSEPSPIRISTKESCDAPEGSEEVGPTILADCELYIDDPLEYLVALGNFYFNDIV